MTKRERERMRRAIRLIHADEEVGGDYAKGMLALCKLAGLKWDAAEPTRERKVSIFEVAARCQERNQYEARND